MVRREILVALSTTLLVLAVLTVPLGFLFGPTLARGDVAAFRDGAHFYLPLWSWIGAEQQAGRWPSWNPLENLGQSLVADPTAAIFYPGRVILALPFAPAANFNLFLITHLALAAGGGCFAARSVSTAPTSRTAALIAGLSYACGAPVLFQYSNPIYLIGAAWLPWSLAFGVRWLRGDGVRACMASAAALAMMFLGGDPQTAYHALLALAVAPLFGMRPTDDHIRSLAFFASVVGRLAPLALLTFGLAAVQILPASRAAEESARAPGRNARSLWELAGRSGSAKDLVRTAMPGSHDEQIYDFSVGPWRWPELVWPNISGRMFPTHHRWISAVPAEGRVWTPSLYSGLWPILLALATLQFRRRSRQAGQARKSPDADAIGDDEFSTRERRTTTLTTTSTAARWLTALAVFSLLAACGAYGAVWLARELQWQLLRKPPAADGWNGAVGGLYWWCVTVLPSYAYFRYPAKWLTIFTMAVALLAALGWDRLSDASFRLRVRRISRFVAVASVIGLALLTVLWSSGIWAEWLRDFRDAWFGPLDTADAARDAARALAQSITLAIGLELLLIAKDRQTVAAESPLSRTTPSNHSRPSQFRLSRSASVGVGVSAASIVATGVIVLDLLLANHWLVEGLPASPFAEFSSSETTRTAGNNATVRPGRIYRPESSGTLPSSWSERSSTTRLVDTSRLERAAWQLRWNQLTGRAVVSSEETLGTREWQAVFESASSTTHDELRPDIARLLGIGAKAPSAESVATRLESTSADKVHSTNNTDFAPSAPPLPRAWLVSHVTVLEALSPGAESNDAKLLEQTRLVFGDRADARNWAEEAVVELPSKASQDLRDQLSLLSTTRGHRAASPNAENEGGENRNAERNAATITVEIVSSEPNRIVFEVFASNPALLVVADRFTDDWTAQLSQTQTTARVQDSPVLRTDRVLRGVLVPAGRVQVTMRYEPRRARLGGVISLASLIVAIATALRGRRRSRE